jgi:hypothetical protein
MPRIADLPCGTIGAPIAAARSRSMMVVAITAVDGGGELALGVAAPPGG